MILGGEACLFVGVQGLVDVHVNLRPLAGGKWDILLFILFFGSEFGSFNPKNWPKSVEFLVLGVPWLGSLCQKGTPKKPTPGYTSVYNHILQYTTQKRESQHPYTTLTPSHCAPTEPSRSIPAPSRSKQR